MTRREEYESKAEQMLMPILLERQFELVDLEYVKEAGSWYLRAYIDKDGGITINDCEEVSRIFSDLLDKDDFIEDSYILEVSSPGLGRQIKKDKDFERNIGYEVELKLFTPVDGQKEYTGILESYDKNTVTLSDSEGNSRQFERKSIALIREAVDF